MTQQTLQYIDLDTLHVSPLNVRKYGTRHISDVVDSIKTHGLLQPLLVRPNRGGYEIIAGQRRYRALQHLAEQAEHTAGGQGKETTAALNRVPCLIMGKSDNAAAIEASLTENIARLPMDEIDQYKAFAALIKQGQSAADIASTFGITERLVTQRLAIANLLPPILTLYRKGKIEAETLRALTLAPKARQKDWLALYRDDNAPPSHRLKAWLFGGADIPVKHALFDIADYTGHIVSDLFGDDQYFDDAETFWHVQNAAIAKARQAYLVDGWTDVVIGEVGQYFPRWDYVDMAKEQGGKVFIIPAHDGDVRAVDPQRGQQTRHTSRTTKRGRRHTRKTRTHKTDAKLSCPAPPVLCASGGDRQPWHCLASMCGDDDRQYIAVGRAP